MTSFRHYLSDYLIDSTEPENEDELLESECDESDGTSEKSLSCDISDAKATSECVEKASDSNRSSQSFESFDAESVEKESEITDTIDKTLEDLVTCVTHNHHTRTHKDIVTNARMSDEDKVVSERKSTQMIENKDDCEISSMTASAEGEETTLPKESNESQEMQKESVKENEEVFEDTVTIEEISQEATVKIEELRDTNRNKQLSEGSCPPSFIPPTRKSEGIELGSQRNDKERQTKSSNVLRITERFGGNVFKPVDMRTEIKSPSISPQSFVAESALSSHPRKPTASPQKPTQNDEKPIEEITTTTLTVPQDSPQSERHTSETDEGIIGTLCGLAQRVIHHQAAPKHVYHAEESDSNENTEPKSTEEKILTSEIPHPRTTVPHEQSESDRKSVCSDQTIPLDATNENTIQTSTSSVPMESPRVDKSIEYEPKSDISPQMDTTLPLSQREEGEPEARHHLHRSESRSNRPISDRRSDICVHDGSNDESSTDPSSSVRSSAVEEANFKENMNDQLSSQIPPNGFKAIVSKFEPKMESPKPFIHSKSDELDHKLFEMNSFQPKASEKSQQNEVDDSEMRSSNDTNAESLPITSSCASPRRNATSAALQDAHTETACTPYNVPTESKPTSSISIPIQKASVDSKSKETSTDEENEPKAPQTATKMTSSSTRASRALIKKSKHPSPFTLWLRNTFSKPLFGKLKFTKRKSDSRI